MQVTSKEILRLKAKKVVVKCVTEIVVGGTTAYFTEINTVIVWSNRCFFILVWMIKLLVLTELKIFIRIWWRAIASLHGNLSVYIYIYIYKKLSSLAYQWILLALKISTIIEFILINETYIRLL